MVVSESKEVAIINSHPIFKVVKIDLIKIPYLGKQVFEEEEEAVKFHFISFFTLTKSSK